MRSYFFLLMGWLGTAVVSGQSTPGWWKYVPPDSTSIVGIRWQTAQSTLFAPAIQQELEQLSDFDFLHDAEYILVVGPSMLAIASGSFSQESLRQLAAMKGLKRGAFKSAELWISPDITRQSVALVSDKLLLIGPLQEVQAALSAHYRSSMLARAAQYSEEDLWVIASHLPDPLASRFVPIEIEATAFEGSVSAWDGLHLVAAMEQASPARALDLADDLETALDSHPAMASGTEITTHQRSVLVRMDLDERQLAASLRPVPAAVAITSPSEPTPLPHAPAIKILGLATGTREIPLGR